MTCYGCGQAAALALADRAVAYRLYGTDYFAAEGRARHAGRGMWAGEFTQPWEWRQQQRR